MEERKELSYALKNILVTLVPGIVFIVAGIVMLRNDGVSITIALILMSCTTIFLLVLKRLPFEKNDEMSRFHHIKAESDGFSVIIFLITIMSTYEVLRDEFNLPIKLGWCPGGIIVLGMVIIFIGFRFRQLERKGD